MRGAEEGEEPEEDTGSNRRFQGGKKITLSTRPPDPGSLGLRARQQSHPGSRRRGRQYCQEGTVGGGGRPSHHPAPGEGRQPRLPPGGPAATSSHPEKPGVRGAADGAEPARPPMPSALVLQHPGPGPGLVPGPSLDQPGTPRPTGRRLRAVRPPSGPSKAAFPSPHVSAAAAGTTTLSDVRVPPAAQSSAAGPVPFTPPPPKPREGGGSGAEGAG